MVGEVGRHGDVGRKGEAGLQLDAAQPLPGGVGQGALRASSPSSPLRPSEDRAAEAMALARARLGETGARALYRERFQPIVKRAGWLGATGRTTALTLSLLAGSAVWYFVWELTALNGVLVWMVWARGRANRDLAAPPRGGAHSRV